MKDIKILKSVKLIEGEVVNTNGVIYDKDSLSNAENNLKEMIKDCTLFTNLYSEQPKDNIREMLTTEIGSVSTIGYITNINEESVDIRLFDNSIFIDLNPDDFRVAYRLLGDYNNDNKFIKNKIVAIDVLPKEKFVN